MKKLLLFVSIILITSASYGQFTSSDVLDILRKSWKKSVIKVNVFFDAGRQNAVTFTNNGEPVDAAVVENYVEVKDSSENMMYLPIDKLKGMLYIPDSKEFHIYMIQ